MQCGATKHSAVGIFQDGKLTVRHLIDTDEDAEFAGKMKVEAFRKKYEHATSRGSIGDCIRTTTLEHRCQDTWFYERHLVAEFNGMPVGIIVIAFPDDPNPIYEDSDFEQFGCTDICGLICLARSSKVTIEENQCYIHHICIDKNFHGKGIGKILLNLAEQEAKSRNYKETFLWVSSDNKAKDFFKRQGYTLDVSTSKCCFIWCSTGRWRLQKMVKRLETDPG